MHKQIKALVNYQTKQLLRQEYKKNCIKYKYKIKKYRLTFY